MKERITFFENIFYWIWWYLLKLSKRWYTPPHSLACTLLSALKVINFFWLIFFLSFILNINLLTLISGDAVLLPILILLAIGFLLMRSDEKKYEEKADQIAGKFELLSSSGRLKKKIIFLAYIIITIFIFASSQPMVDSFLNK